MNKLAYLILILLCSSQSFSQFNDSTNYYVSYASTGVINKTNDASSYVLTNALRFSVKKKSISLNNNTTWVYGQQQHHLSNNDFSNSLDFNLFKTFKHFYYWGLGNYDKSYSLNINSRVQVGLGVAYGVIDKDNAFFNISDGILYESSDIKINDSTRENYNTFRNSLRVRYRFAHKDLLILEGTAFVQNSVSDKNDYIIRSSTNLSVKLKKWLSLTTSATYNRLNRTNRETLLITYGLRAETYF